MNLHTLYRESEWYEFVDCQRIHDKPQCQKDECNGCMELYNDLIDDVMSDFEIDWKKKGYVVNDIQECDFDSDGWQRMKFMVKLVKEEREASK